MMKHKIKYLFLILICFGITSIAKAQNSTDVKVTANIISRLEVTTMQDLNFGDVIQGNTKLIQPTDNDAGMVKVVGQANDEVNISFQLPTELINGSDALPITFNATSAGYGYKRNSNGVTKFNPNNGLVDIPLDNKKGEMYIYIGGEISPSPTQTATEYQNTITVTVDYN